MVGREYVGNTDIQMQENNRKLPAKDVGGKGLD
jgi:hypothetical protein